MNSDIFHICNANAADLFLNVKVKRTSPNGISAVTICHDHNDTPDVCVALYLPSISMTMKRLCPS